jgi:hypothetical protein
MYVMSFSRTLYGLVTVEASVFETVIPGLQRCKLIYSFNVTQIEVKK